MDETYNEQDEYSLHQSIPFTRENLKIADVGSGTGEVWIWVVELSRKLPSSTQLDRFNPDSNDFPPKHWVTSNVAFHELDAFSTLPIDLVEKYDIVRLEKFVDRVKDNDPVPLLRNLIRMLKPGGYIQWEERDPVQIMVPVDPTTDSKTVHSMLAGGPIDDTMSPPPCPQFWVSELADTFAAQGLLESRLYRYPLPPRFQRFDIDNILATTGEECSELRKLFAAAQADPQQRVAIHRSKVVVVGQKPTIHESKTQDVGDEKG